MKKFVQYGHFGVKVWVRSDLKGKHREHCLCFQCDRLKIDEKEPNCEIADENYAFCVKHHLVLPVWECPEFVEKEK